MKYKCGKEYGIPFPVTKAWISKGLRKYVTEDKYGIYKEKDIKIPLIYKQEYNRCKKYREMMIKHYYKRLENITDLDKIEMEKLLRMG